MLLFREDDPAQSTRNTFPAIQDRPGCTKASEDAHLPSQNSNLSPRKSSHCRDTLLFVSIGSKNDEPQTIYILIRPKSPIFTLKIRSSVSLTKLHQVVARSRTYICRHLYELARRQTSTDMDVVGEPILVSKCN